MSAHSALAQLWREARLPPSSLSRANLAGSCDLPTTFRVAQLAQATIAASALSASSILAMRRDEDLTEITVNARDAVAEFRCEALAQLDGVPGKAWDSLAGQYRAKDGWIRPHTNFQHHRSGILSVMNLPDDASREDLSRAFASRNADEVAEAAMERGLVATSLRSFEEWDATLQGQVAAARTGGPISVECLRPRPPKPLPPLTTARPLAGIRVLDLTRVIAGPTAGRTLAAYGADVLWITSPHLPSLPPFDADTARGKRTTQLDLRIGSPDREKFIDLVREADVLLQSYRPDGLASLGFSAADLVELNPDLIYATLSAWGEEGPWSKRKGFDSLVQFAVGINEAEGRAYGEHVGRSDFEPKPMPCQALDHASGYLLAFGIQVALLRRATEGGAYKVENSLLSTATWLRSLGRAPSSSFDHKMETREELGARGRLERFEGFGGAELETVKHAARMAGADVGCKTAPRGYNDVGPTWLQR